MPEDEPRSVLLDANLFVAAIKNPSRETDTYRLVVHLLERKGIHLVGNVLLAQEYLRYAEVFPSPTAAALAAALAEKMEIVRVEDRFVLACSPHFPRAKGADCVHAATCLQTGAILVSNDKDFDSVAKAGLVRRWTAADAVRHWLPPPRR
jgi:predicted nucleic acid-binding protein